MSTSPASSNPEQRPARDTYTGPDYRAVLAGEWGPPDPLLHPDPYRPPRLYRLVVAVLRWLLRRLLRITVEGLENLPTGPYILASNHQAWFDPALLLLAVPAAPMIYSMARRDTVFDRGWKRSIVRRLGVFAISPADGDLDRVGVASVYHVLSRGGRILMFPEGRYSRGRALRPLKKGVAHFALQAGVPIVPVAIDGVDRLHFRSRVTISIGTPVYPDPPTWWNSSRRVRKVVESVRRAILRAFDREPKAPEARLLARLRGRMQGLLARATSRRGRSPS